MTMDPHAGTSIYTFDYMFQVRASLRTSKPPMGKGDCVTVGDNKINRSSSKKIMIDYLNREFMRDPERKQLSEQTGILSEETEVVCEMTDT